MDISEGLGSAYRMTISASLSLLLGTLSGGLLADEAARPHPDDALKILGDYAGRMMVVLANGEKIYSGQRPLEPEGVSWHLDMGDPDWPVTLEVVFPDCHAPFIAYLGQQDAPHTLLVQGCELSLLK